jgi:hypothetical protein
VCILDICTVYVLHACCMPVGCMLVSCLLVCCILAAVWLYCHIPLAVHLRVGAAHPTEYHHAWGRVGQSCYM